MRRSDQRRDAAFALYQRDVTGRPLQDLLAGARPFTRDLAEGADAHLAEIDAEIAANAHGWTIQRIAPLERGIMRIAVFEMLHREEIPVPVSIDEAVSIAGRYCGTEAPGFVNGILSAVARKLGTETEAPA
ncbi:MAG: transcription antitermination factor NusB [Solirubrobacterales bacterium]|nr:transcription antitermination factor NusB [Solirubrobacterales bacterium]